MDEITYCILMHLYHVPIRVLMYAFSLFSFMSLQVRIRGDGDVYTPPGTMYVCCMYACDDLQLCV